MLYIHFCIYINNTYNYEIRQFPLGLLKIDNLALAAYMLDSFCDKIQTWKDVLRDVAKPSS